MAGKRKGTADDRHLWPQMLRAIREIQPRWIVGENVPGLVNWSGGLVFEQVQADLEAAGYEVTPFILPACAVNAPHRRDRVWIVAHKPDTGIENMRQVRENEICKSTNATNAEKCENNRNGSGGFFSEFTGINEPGTTPNSDKNIRGGKKWKLLDEQEQRRYVQKISETLPSGDAADTDWRIGRKGRLYQSGPGQAKRHIGTRNTRINECGTWLNFPTQPPVRGRNDGLSGELDGITVSKHRNESIKAYGNAIVPQVAYQIFKAINEYENQSNNR